MILNEIKQVKRVGNFFYVDGHYIKADRISSPGYGVLVVFEPSKLDRDFQQVIGANRFCWFPYAESLSEITKQLDLSDHLTRDWLRNGKGWDKGVRPFPDKLEDFL